MKKLIIAGSITAIALVMLASIALAGSRSNGWLGVYTESVDRDLAEAFSLKSDRGAIINEVVEDSPADKAGLEEDDIIIFMGGERVRDTEDLVDLVADTDPGDKVILMIVRDANEQEIEVEIGRRPRSSRWFGNFNRIHIPRAPSAPRAPRAPHARSYSFSFSDDDYSYIGVSLLDISRRTAKSLGADDHGVLIDEVKQNSPAEKAGLEPGDLIIAIGGDDVFDASDVQEIISDMEEGETAKIDLIRNRSAKTLEVEVEEGDSRRHYGSNHILRLPDLAQFDLRAPRMKGLYFGHSFDTDFDDDFTEEFEEEMEKLQREMKKLQRELREVKESLQ